MSLSPESLSCQRWSDRSVSWRHVSEGGFDSRQYTVEPIAEAAARAFTLQHHYSGSYPAARLAYGLTTSVETPDAIEIDGRQLVGVAVLSVPMSASVLTNVFPGLEPFAQSLELGRFVLADDVPANAESWFLGQVWRRAAESGVRGVVSFADPMPRSREVLAVDDDGEPRIVREQITPGHVGVIYQATNAMALGRSTARTLTYVPRAGLVISDRTLQKVRARERGADGAERHLVELGARPRAEHADPRMWLRDALDEVGAVKLRHPGNFRYAWALGGKAERRRVQLAMERTGYPKADAHRMPDEHGGALRRATDPERSPRELA